MTISVAAFAHRFDPARASDALTLLLRSTAVWARIGTPRGGDAYARQQPLFSPDAAAGYALPGCI